MSTTSELKKEKEPQREAARQASAEQNHKASLLRNSLDRYNERLIAAGERSADAGPLLTAPLWTEWKNSPEKWAEFRSALLGLAESEEESELLSSQLPEERPGPKTADLLRYADQLAYIAMQSASAARWKSVIQRMTKETSS